MPWSCSPPCSTSLTHKQLRVDGTDTNLMPWLAAVLLAAPPSPLVQPCLTSLTHQQAGVEGGSHIVSAQPPTGPPEPSGAAVALSRAAGPWQIAPMGMPAALASACGGARHPPHFGRPQKCEAHGGLCTRMAEKHSGLPLVCLCGAQAQQLAWRDVAVEHGERGPCRTIHFFNSRSQVQTAACSLSLAALA